MIREVDGTGHFLCIKEGVTQGDPLTMVTYVLGILHLFQELSMSQPSVTQTYYADDAGEGGTFAGIRRHFDDLMMRGSLRANSRSISRA